MTRQPKTQWDCIRENLGEWQGTFTELTPDGERVKETPSVLTLTEDMSGQSMSLVLTRTPSGQPPDQTVLNFSYPGPAPYVYFFKTGAFSQGSLQWRAFSQFGAELAFKVADRRLRLVQMYEGQADGTSLLKYITLIREKRPGSQTPERPHLGLQSLLGDWVGSAIVFDPVSSKTMVVESQWALSQTGNQVSLESSVESCVSQSMSLTLQDNCLRAVGYPWQMCLLADGASAALPRCLQAGTAFRLESAWLVDDRCRQRLIRQYDATGTWTHLIFATEYKQV